MGNWFVADLRNRTTGDTVATIYGGYNPDEAADVAYAYNINNFGKEVMDDIDTYDDLMYGGKYDNVNPDHGLFADFYEIEDPCNKVDIKKGNERMSEMNTATKDKMLIVTVYCDSTGLYTEWECIDDNLVDMEFPQEVVREYFYTKIKQYYGDTTFEEWLSDKYDADDTDGLFSFAKERGFTASRPDGLNPDTVKERVKASFMASVKDLHPVIGCWDVSFCVDGEYIGTQGDIHKGDGWNEFFEWLFTDMVEEGSYDRSMENISNVEFVSIEYAGIDNKKHFMEDLIDFDKMTEERVEYGREYKGYMMSFPFEAIECSHNNGSLPDLDWMVHLKGILDMPISWELYHYINCKYDGSLMELDKSDYVMLMGWVNEYAMGCKADE